MARRLGMARLVVEVAVQPGQCLAEGRQWRCGHAVVQEAARRLRLDLAGGSPSGTRVGFTRSRTTARSITQRPTSVRLGRSYITSSSTSSRMARRPRAPVPRAGLARPRPPGRLPETWIGDPVELEHPLVLLDERILGLDQDADQGVLEMLGHGAHHRQTPDDLGDQADLDEVFGQDTPEESTSSRCAADTSAWKPMPRRPMWLSIILSRPSKAPPQMKRMLVVSI